jgi:hypothetical protein
MISNEKIQDRLRATCAVQTTIADRWVWSEMSVAQWDAKLAELEQMQEAVADRNAIRNGAAGDMDLALQGLYEQCKVVLTLARVQFRKEPPKLALFSAVSLSKDSRAAMVAGAAALEAAWLQTEPGWVPLPGVTAAAFRTQREGAEAAVAKHAQAEAAWRRESERLRELLKEVHGLCVAWYAAATALFPPGTAAGETIRSQIPTGYSPAAEARRRERRAAKAAGGTEAGGTAPGG